MDNKIFKVLIGLILILTLPAAGVSAAPAKNDLLKNCMVSQSYGQSAVLTPDGVMLIVGDNEYGWIGNGTHGDYDGDTLDNLVLKPYAVMQDVAFISIQNLSCYAIKKDHTLWSWGFDHREALGNGSEIRDTYVPNKILDNVKFVATGHGLHMLAIKEDNTLWGWGQNEYGQVGDGGTEDVPEPVKVMSHIKYAAVGYGSSAVIKEDNTLWVWGRNDHGELGIGSKKEVMKPVKIMEDVKTVTMGFHRTCVLKNDGTVWTFGQNDHGEIGDGTTTERYKPVKVLSDVASITTKAEGHILALKKDGTVWAWGDNEEGAIGDGTRIDRYKPVKVMSDVQMVDSNTGMSIALKKDGTVWTWGLNECGQLGTGDTRNRLNPVKILDFNTISEGKNYTIPAYYIDGQLEDWSEDHCVYQNTAEADEKNPSKLEVVYADRGTKYFYLAIKASGQEPWLHVNFDNNGDGKPEYNSSIGFDKKLVWINKSIGNDKWEEVSQLQTVSYDNGIIELRYPLSDIGNPKTITAEITIFSEDGTSAGTNGFIQLTK